MYKSWRSIPHMTGVQCLSMCNTHIGEGRTRKGGYSLSTEPCKLTLHTMAEAKRGVCVRACVCETKIYTTTISNCFFVVCVCVCVCVCVRVRVCD